MEGGNEVYCKEEGLPSRCLARRSLIKCICCVTSSVVACHSRQMILAISSLKEACGKIELHGFPFIFLWI
jgi:hypothetical protein